MSDFLIVDNRTPHLDLPLPSEHNELQDDLPRLRQALKDIDSHAKTTDEKAAALEEQKATRDELIAEAQTRAEGESALARGIAKETEERIADVRQEAEARQEAMTQESQAREAGDELIAEALQKESKAQTKALAAETAARQKGMQDHEGDNAAHDALIRRVTVGDLSPVIGVCQVQNGNYTGLWAHCDAEGQPVAPNARYFDYHPIYSNMKRVLVDGQVMIEVPAFWFKHFNATSGPFKGKWCKVISPVPLAGFRLYPAFRSASGAELSKIYIGAYAATNEGGNPVRLGSRPGKYPHVNVTIGTMVEQCANRNVGGVSGFAMWDIYDYHALCLLFLIEHAHTDSQSVMGRGWVDSSSAVVTDHENQCVWRGFYGLFGNVWQFVDGLRLTPSREIEIFKNNGSRTWVNTKKICPSYDGTNATRITALHTGTGSGFNLDDLFLPAAHSTDHSQGMFPDNFWGGWASAGNITIIGGCWSGSSGAGLFCLYLQWTTSNAGTSVGCRSAKH